MTPNVGYHLQPTTSFHPYPAQYYTTSLTNSHQPLTEVSEQGGKMGETPASEAYLNEFTDKNNSSSQPNEPPPALVGEAPPPATNMQSHQPGQELQQEQAQAYPHNMQPTSLPDGFAQHFPQQQHVYAVDMTTPLVTPPAAPLQSPLSPTSDEALNDPNKKKKKGVPHVYHDYSSVQDQLGYVRKKTGGVTQPFPEKLMEMLTAEADNQTLCGWLPHGRAFIVRKPKQFTQEIMPKYFRQSKLTSFQRQLNLYGFRRITQGADAGAYYHELFLRGRPQLCMRMNRQKVKGTGHKQPADAQSEPNFYTMPAPTQNTAGYIPPQSPGIQGLQGAADLLKGFAAGIPVSSVSGATWPTTVQLAAPAPGAAQQYIYASSAGSQQPQMIYTQGPNGQPQMQQIMYAPAPGQASLTMGADGQFYFTAAPAPYAMAAPAPYAIAAPAPYTMAAPAPYAMAAPAPYAMAAPAPVSGEQQQQQSYSTVAPAPSIMTYAPAPPDGTPASYAPTVQFVWPQQQQHSGQQAWIHQAQQIQQIAQPTMQTQQQAPDQVPQPQVQQYQQQYVPQGEQQQDQQVAYAQQPALAPTSATSN